ncbi:MAG: hypothetical protein QME65_05620 [Candidatus Omnitrophota bacterium]|nr:hypothetical protein [Candidatus Omnitrophota bacterium]
MDKKDIYEHLAKIYLDASSKKKKRSKGYPNVLKNILLVSVVLVFIVSVSLLAAFQKDKPFDSEVILVLSPDLLKINFDFNPAKKEIYYLDLNKLDLSKYKILGFSLKKENYNDSIALRVEFITAFKEKSEVYFKNIPHKWQDYKINLSEFNGINDWSHVARLAFIVEEWNTKEKKGVLYIDNVRVIR